MIRRVTGLVLATVVLLTGCSFEPGDVPTPTAPRDTAPTPTSPTSISPPTTDAPNETVIELPNLFGIHSDRAVEELEALDFVVVAYEVCSGSVEAGEVRQIVYPDATELVGQDGVTPEGKEVPYGSVLEVKIGTGEPCG